MVNAAELNRAGNGERLVPATVDATIRAISLEQSLSDAAVANARVVDLTHRLIDITREAQGLRMQLQQAHSRAPVADTSQAAELTAQLYHARVENEALHAQLRVLQAAVGAPAHA